MLLVRSVRVLLWVVGFAAFASLLVLLGCAKNNGGDAALIATGKTAFDTNGCARCHSVGRQAGTGESDADDGPPSDLTLDLQFPSMRLGDTVADRQPEAGAALGAGARGVHPVESIADVGQVLGRDSFPRVRDRDHHLVPLF